MKRRVLIIASVVLACVAAAGGYRMWQLAHRPPDTVLPTFTEPGPGAKAPHSRGFGVEVGRTTLAEVQALIAQRGISCKDTSARALMQQMREKKLAEIEDKKARGESVDAVSGASLVKKRSPRERNPQVRLSCEDIQASAIGDHQRPEEKGRWLFIFDSPELPLRHVSFRRIHRDHRLAFAALRSSLEGMTALYGPPLEQVGELPAPPEEPAGEERLELFPRLKPLKYRWKYADLLVEVSALNFGRRGVDVLESIEVPWPVRADAPTLPASSAGPATATAPASSAPASSPPASSAPASSPPASSAPASLEPSAIGPAGTTPAAH